MLTLAQSVAITGKAVHDYLPADLDVPQIDRAGAQGDVLVFRAPIGDGRRVWDEWLAELPARLNPELRRWLDTRTGEPATTPMPRCVVAVASEASSNTHTLHPNGPCFWTRHTADNATDLVLGVLTVPEGSSALLSHQEHGNLEILPGTYEVRRQREFSGEWAYVRD